jgi:cytochrome P450
MSRTSDAVTVADLDADPHPVLARLRASEGPAAWVPALGAWLVTGYDAAVAVLRDSRTFTVDDPRFATARVVGPSMLSLDGTRHAHHRGPFGPPFRADAVDARLAEFTEAETDRLVSAIESHGEAELRRAVAGPLAVAVMAEALGLGDTEPATILGWYDEIVAATAGQAGASPEAEPPSTAAFTHLADSLRRVISGPGHPALLAEVAGPLTEAEVISNAAVLMFGGIETTEGMIANAILHLLANPAVLAQVRDDPALVPAAVEESLRLEPAAAVVDRYATRDTAIGEAAINAGDQVTVSISGANRDPAVFPDPDSYRLHRQNAAKHLAFAHGPHFCLGAHLARLEARVAVAAVLARLPRLRLAGPASARGLVFRKPPELRVRWDSRGGSVLVMTEEFHRDRREHGGSPDRLDDDQLARLTEEERVDAGLAGYDPDEVPPATDEPPLPEDLPPTDQVLAEEAEIRREVDRGELRTIDEQHPFPPSHYEDS